MASEMDWSHDFCLACDRQIAEGAYCSQACRLADLEKPSEGFHYSTSASSSRSMPSPTRSGSTGFHLPPAVNFAAYKSNARVGSPPSSPNYYTTTTGHASYLYFSQSTPTTSADLKHALTTSPSRSSLSSISSTRSTQGLSAQAASELRGYSNCFDQVRDLKRRLTYA